MTNKTHWCLYSNMAEYCCLLVSNTASEKEGYIAQNPTLSLTTWGTEDLSLVSLAFTNRRILFSVYMYDIKVISTNINNQ